jgi:hypothetical protein
MTLEQATLARSYWKSRALWVMHKKSREVNETHMCKNGNLMRQEASESGTVIAIITIITCNLSARVLQWHISTNYSLLFGYLREKCYQVSPLVIPGNAG